ncbi:LacI family DNA-binding transcriptional regulator [Naasia sp. SYSU D00057]|uniref:LacI family DNA-binding transcriptional regulator n=1 Tax=Naasia sp. SYSU D00057 TaxID=2817380 RepID=UPI0027DBE1F3|nr:LacI family DNA-binding transcriptional regulator [Naasia sp. SYSU D00057]
MTGTERTRAKRATIYDVARHAGVSHQTVSRYLRGYENIRPETRERVEAALGTLDYRANIPARNLRQGRTGAISLAVPSLNQPYFAELAQSVISAAREQGLTVFVETMENDRQRELEVLSRSRGNLVDGVLFAPTVVTAEELRQQEVTFPLVLLGDRIFHSDFDHVAMANAAGARAAVQHLISLGRSRIAAIGVEPPGSAGAAQLRRDGYRQALEEAGLPLDPALEREGGSWIKESGVRSAEALLASGVEFDAVFGFNDALALGALRALLRAGVRVPDDVAVVGFDDTEDGLFSTPSLTSISPGRDEIARLAVELLTRQFDGSPHEPAREVEASFSLSVRESTMGIAAA